MRERVHTAAQGVIPRSRRDGTGRSSREPCLSLPSTLSRRLLQEKRQTGRTQPRVSNLQAPTSDLQDVEECKSQTLRGSEPTRRLLRGCQVPLQAPREGPRLLSAQATNQRRGAAAMPSAAGSWKESFTSVGMSGIVEQPPRDWGKIEACG